MKKSFAGITGATGSERPESRRIGAPGCAAVDLSAEPTIRFTIDPRLLKRAEEQSRARKDTYVGRPLLSEEPEKRRAASAPRWVRIAAAGALSVAVLLTFAAVLTNAGPSADDVTDTFLSAMAGADYDTFSKVAVGSGVNLTEESVQPLFALYQSDADFRAEVEQSLHAQAKNAGLLKTGVFRLTGEKKLFRTDYRVQISGCDVDISSNLAGAQVTMDQQEAVTVAPPEVQPDGDSSVQLSGVLPGSYTVHAAFTADYGAKFETQCPLSVTGLHHNTCDLNFDYTSLEIYNDSKNPVDLEIGEDASMTVNPQSDIVLSPIAPEAEVVAVRQTGSGDNLTQSAKAAEGYFYVSFALCRLEVYNDYSLPMQVLWNGEPYCEIQPHDMTVLEDVPSGDIISAELAGCETLGDYTYEAAFDYDYLYPVFSLSDELALGMSTAAEAYIRQAYDVYATQPDALGSLPRTGLTRDLGGYCDAAAASAAERPTLDAGDITFGECELMDAAPDGTLTASVTASYPCTSAQEDDLTGEMISQEQDCSYCLTLGYDAENWTVLEAD